MRIVNPSMTVEEYDSLDYTARHGQRGYRPWPSTRAMRKLSPLVELGARRHQIGADEYKLLFAPALLRQVAGQVAS